MARTISVYFIGAGPGALDLMTVRAQELIRRADLVLFADSLVNPEIASLAKPGAEVIGSAKMALEEMVARMVEAARRGKLVARVHSGDPSLFGAIREQMVGLIEAGVEYEVVPGVSSVFAAAAALGVELTVPEVNQTLIVGRAEGRTPVPEGQRLSELAVHQSTMAVYLSAGMIEKVESDLLDGGYPAETPVAVVYRASWPDQRIVRCTVGTMASTLKESGIDRQALILVGRALAPVTPGGEAASLLYDVSFSHGYRPARSEQE